MGSPESDSQQLKMRVMQDLIDYTVENLGNRYGEVAGTLYCALVNLVLSQLEDDVDRAIIELTEIGTFYQQRMRLAAMPKEGVRH